MDIADYHEDHWDYRAELYARTPDPAVSPSPVLQEEPHLPPDWWTSLRDSLNALSTVHTERVAIREEYMRRVIPQYTGHTIDTIKWTTAHGDLHWANLTAPNALLLDWEVWGVAPVGYDATSLLLHSLHVPPLANRVRATFADTFDTPESRGGQLVACAEILQAAPRVPFYAQLADAIHAHLATLR
ncbi:hypothetical protein [Streptomyces noursei]